jgi:putative oxidoreductase
MSIASSALSLRRRLLSLTDKLSGLAPLLIRITVGIVFVRTGWGKLSDLPKITEYFDSLGIPMPGLNAAVAASVEFFGGILILAGLGARLVALPMAFTMVVAIITAKRDEIEGVLSILGFDEWAYLVMFIVIVLIGAGPLSLDALIARRLRNSDGDGKAAALPRPLLRPETSSAPQG